MLTVTNPKRFDWKNISLSDCCEGNAADSYFTLKLFSLLIEKFEELRLTEFFESVLVPSSTIFSEMEFSGLEVCPDKLNSVGKIIKSTNIETEDSLYSFDEVEPKDNLSSTRNLSEILYTKEGGFELYPPDKTSKGAPSVSAPTLKILLEHIELELNKRNASTS
tara:strand:+ start:32 stop:523 length:492 start_codon:yes stop_codon:yes gene_type:complete